MAASLAANNVGPDLLGSVYKKTVDALYQDLKQNNPEVAKQVAGQKETDALKQQIVVANVPEKDFNEKLITTAPKALYTSKDIYDTYHRGLENRLRGIIGLYPPEARVDPDKL
jgi:hypothetical protein